MFNWPRKDQWKKIFPDLCGLQELTIHSVATLRNPSNRTCIFANTLTEEQLDALHRLVGCLLILPANRQAMTEKLLSTHGVIFTDNPRYRFAEVLNQVTTPVSLRGLLHPDPVQGITLGPNVSIHPTAVIEPGVTIAQDCVISAGCHLMAGACIGPRVCIGKRTLIREHAVVGGFGFGFALATGKTPLRIPHLGGVIIGNDVEVGALTTICSGTIDPTIIEDGVKIDDHVHIAHNVHLENGSIIVACAEVSGSVRIGAGSWLSPQSCVIDRIQIGKNCTVGIGAVVTKSLPNDAIVCGNPARPIKVVAAERKKLERLLE